MAVSDQLKAFRGSVAGQKETVYMLLGLLVIFIALLTPLPPLGLDIFLALNITISVIVLMVVIFLRTPLELSSFPSVLLGLTLYRLTLNIASVRLILGPGDEFRAGHLIPTFGNVVAGSGAQMVGVLVGFIIFLIIIIVQFVVITKGSGRIAEVAARFTLDAMPGKQMAIDADLNAGIIDEAQARRRREDLSRQAEFYGAMDGAAKFVRGDAIAGLIITAINLVGGLIVGMAIYGKEFGFALSEYTRLTIGDGLVTQIPALLVSVASGLIITKGETEDNLGLEVYNQLFTRKAAIIGGGVFLVVLGLFIGPLGGGSWSFFLLTVPAGVLLFFFGNRMADDKAREEMMDRKRRSRAGPGKEAGGGAAGKAGAKAADGQPEDVSGFVRLDTLELEVGYSLIPLVDANQGGDLLERITLMRRQLAVEMGLLVKPIRVRDNMQLPPNDYAIKMRGSEVARATALPDQFLAMDSGVVTEKVEGLETKEPAFGLPAVWIPESLRETASLGGYTVVDATTVISTHLTETVKRHAADLLSRQTVSEILDKQKEATPAIVDEVKERLTLSDLQNVLKNLLREKVSIRNMETILETLGDYAPRIKDPEMLTEYVRAAMARDVCAPLVDGDQVLFCVTLAPALEERLEKAVQRTEGGAYLALDPDFLQKLVQAVSAQLERLVSSGHHPVILCSGQVRFLLSRQLRGSIPNVHLLSYNEIMSGVKVESTGTVQVAGA